MIKKLLTNKKIITALFVLLVLVVLSLGFRPKLPGISPAITPTPTVAPKKAVSNLQGLGFDSLVLEKQPTIVASAGARFPGEVSTYEINPAPFELFSPQTVSALAAHFGFTAAAKVSSSGSLYIYREKDKTLTLDHQIGTISFTTDLSKISGGTGLSKEQAGQKVEEFLKASSLNSQFINWQKGEVKSLGLVQGTPKETGLAQELKFYQVAPDILINEIQLLIPQPLYAQVSTAGEIVGLYTWFINLDGENPQLKTLKNLDEAKKEVAAGQGVLFSSVENPQKINLGKVDLAYFAPPNFFVDFTTRHFLKIVYVFYDDKGSQVYINAVKE